LIHFTAALGLKVTCSPNKSRRWMMFDQVGSDDAVAFYRRPLFVIATLVIVPPLGLILTWTVSDMDTKTRLMATLAVAAVIILLYIFNALLGAG